MVNQSHSPPKQQEGKTDPGPTPNLKRQQDQDLIDRSGHVRDFPTELLIGRLGLCKQLSKKCQKEQNTDKI
jgi:hypothetical protein